MRDVEQVQKDLDDAIEQRSAALRGSSIGALKQIEERIADLYTELRESKAHDQHGSRATITQRARVERELEKLAKPSPNGDSPH